MLERAILYVVLPVKRGDSHSRETYVQPFSASGDLADEGALLPPRDDPAQWIRQGLGNPHHILAGFDCAVLMLSNGLGQGSREDWEMELERAGFERLNGDGPGVLGEFLPELSWSAAYIYPPSKVAQLRER